MDDLFYEMFPVLRPGYWYGDYDSKKLAKYRFWHDGVGSWLSAGLTTSHIDQSIADAKTEAYLKRWNLKPEDIVDPSKLYSGHFTGAVLNYASSNIRRLYR